MNFQNRVFVVRIRIKFYLASSFFYIITIPVSMVNEFNCFGVRFRCNSSPKVKTKSASHQQKHKPKATLTQRTTLLEATVSKPRIVWQLNLFLDRELGAGELILTLGELSYLVIYTESSFLNTSNIR